MKYAKKQSQFYDQHPPLIPWPELLVEYGFDKCYKLREIFWKKELCKLGIRKGNRILDVGSGTGVMLARICKHFGAKGVGVDISRRSVDQANRCFSIKEVRFKIADATKLPFDNASFDFVVSFDVLEHIENQKAAVTEMVRVLKPGGKMLIYTLSSDDQYTLDWCWEKLGIDIYKRAFHKRQLFVKRSDLRILLSKKCKILDEQLFNAFLTLFYDELMMLAVLLLKKLGLFKSRKLGIIFLNCSNLLNNILYTPLNSLDRLWYRKGKSLGFDIIVQKT